jgi:DNA polymerase-3 subunit chi
MTEVHFYHLQSQPLERALPRLVEKCLEQGWRCVIQAASAERVEALDALLWTYADESFLPHGTEREAEAEDMPVVLVVSNANPNGAHVRFFVDGASAEQIALYERAIHLFDGNDADAVETARARWKEAQAAGFAVTYWQQDESGRWKRRG